MTSNAAKKEIRKETFEPGNMLRKSQKLVYLIFPSWANVLLNGKNLTTTVKLDACNILSSARTERKIVLDASRCTRKSQRQPRQRMSKTIFISTKTRVGFFEISTGYFTRKLVRLPPSFIALIFYLSLEKRSERKLIKNNSTEGNLHCAQIFHFIYAPGIFSFKISVHFLSLNVKNYRLKESGGHRLNVIVIRAGS